MKKLILLLLFIPLVSFGQDDTSIKFSSEQGMREYFDVNNSEGIEGIWQTSGGTSYKILIVKNGTINDTAKEIKSKFVLIKIEKFSIFCYFFRHLKF